MAETIREFLVSLGYKVDPGSEKRFESSVRKATLQAELLGRVIAETAGKVVEGVRAIGKGFDDIYYMSQRTNASVQNIKSLGYAVSQLGGTFQGAVSSIEAFGQKLRSNPGYESMVRSLGVATHQNGKLRDTVEIAKDLAKALGSKPYYVQLQYMEALGLDERTYRALQSGELSRYLEEYRKKQQALGLDQEAAARTGQQLSNAWRQLGLTAATLGEKLMTDLGPHITSIVKRFDDFLVANADKISAFFDKLADLVGKLAEAFIRLVEKGDGPIVDMFTKIEKSVDALQIALAAFAAFLVGSWLVRVLGAFTAVGTGFAAMLLKLGINPATIGFAAGMYPSTANGGEDEEIARRRANGSWGGKNAFNGENAIKDNRSWWQRTMPKWMGGKDAPTKANVSASAAAVSPEGRALLDTIASTEASGYNVMYGGRRFSDYGDHPRQNIPITSGPNAGRTSSAAGRYQFLASTWDAQRKKLGLPDFSPASQDIAAYDLAKTVYRKKTGRSLDDDLKSGDPQTLTGIGAALSGTWTSLLGGIEQGQGSGRFVSSFNRFLERQRAASSGYVPSYTPFSGLNAGSMAAAQTNAALIGGNIQPLVPSSTDASTKVEMKQETNITVLGGSDPAANGSAVADAQKGVNGTMLRNLQGAVR